MLSYFLLDVQSSSDHPSPDISVDNGEPPTYLGGRCNWPALKFVAFACIFF